MNGRFFHVVALALMIITTPAVPTAAQPGPTEDERAQSISVYGWVFGQSGDITVMGREADVDLSVSDAWDALADLDGLFTLHYENRRGPRTVFADVMYFRIEGTAETALGDATYEPSSTIAELGWAVRTNETVGAHGRAIIAEWLAGVRYTNLKFDVLGPLGVIDITDEHDWFDLFIGGRVTGDMSDKWAYWIRADVGGFGIGSSSDFTWNVVLGLQYDLSEQWRTDLGWRLLDYNYSTGSGTDEFGYDVLNSGPFVGFTYLY